MVEIFSIEYVLVVGSPQFCFEQHDNFRGLEKAQCEYRVMGVTNQYVAWAGYWTSLDLSSF